MPYTLYDATVGNFLPGLETLQHLLKKAGEHATAKSSSVDSLLNARLCEDMLPFTFQIHVATDVAQKAVHRLQGSEPESWDKDDLKTVADCEARIAKAVELLKSASRTTVDAKADDQVTMQLGPEKKISMKAGEYANAYSLPNYFFHLTCAYAILRNQGVELGKTDYLKPYLGKYM